MKNFVFNPSDVPSLFLLRTESIEYMPQALRVHSLEFIKYCAMFAWDFFFWRKGVGCFWQVTLRLPPPLLSQRKPLWWAWWASCHGACGCLMAEEMLSLSSMSRPWCRWLSCLLCQSLSRVQLFVTPWTVARQAPLSMGILQARVLAWVAMSSSRESSSRGSSWPRDRTWVSCTAGGFFIVWATREAQILLHHGLLKSAGCRDAQLIIISWHMDYKPCSLPMQTHAVFLFNYTFYGMTETTIMNFCLFFFLVFFF